MFSPELATFTFVAYNDDGNNLLCHCTTWQDLYMWRIEYYSPITHKYYTTTNNNGAISTEEDV